MNKPLTLLLLALPVPALAQDRIGWTDGTFTDPRTRVNEFTAFQVRYTARGSREEDSSDRVAVIEVASVRDAYRRGISTDDPAAVLATAKRLLEDGDKFVAQFGFHRAAKMYLAEGLQEEGFETLDELKAAIPDSGFIPDCYRMKIEYLLAQGRPGGAEAAALADAYATQVLSAGMPQGFGLEAEYYKAMAEFTAGSTNPAGLHRTLSSLLVKVSGPNPTLANRTRLAIGTAARLQGRTEEAKQAYEELAKSEAVDIDTRAGAFLGLGHLAYERTSSDRDNYREALLAFLRVYIETADANDNVVAEALHYASESAKNWQGPDWNFMSQKLSRVLSQEYAHTTWGKPK